MTTTEQRVSVQSVSDADEPGDPVLLGMKHRDFETVELALVPCGEPGDEDWFGTPRTSNGCPTRPVLVFAKGRRLTADEALRIAETAATDLANGLPVPSEISAASEHEEVARLDVSPTFPPYPWLEAARLGMRMGKRFERVELVDWTDPTSERPGSYKFRFFNREHAAATPEDDIKVDDLPY